MSGDRVADIIVGQLDMTGTRIVTVYSKVSERFAVYANEERVVVQFADDDTLGQEQRLFMAGLAPLRGEINGLIDGWRKSQVASVNSRARWYDRRTADAIALALQGDQPEAEKLLTAIKLDIIEERMSLGRYQHLISAAVTAALICLLFWFVTPVVSEGETPPSSSVLNFVNENDIGMAVGLGALGALFSISLLIRSRTVQTDLRRRDNIIDAVLRVVIGSISAFVLFSLLKANFVSLSISGTPVLSAKPIEPGANAEAIHRASVHAAIVAAFLAGFSERLVGDFLSNTVLDAARKPGDSAKGKEDAGTKDSKADSKKASGETNPGGLPDKSAGSGQTKAAATPPDHDHALDDCACGTPLAPEEHTQDVDLPKASGGIVKTAD